jgi:hypothetical protein
MMDSYMGAVDAMNRMNAAASSGPSVSLDQVKTFFGGILDNMDALGINDMKWDLSGDCTGSCHHFTAFAPVGHWGEWVDASEPLIGLAVMKHVISADAVPLPVPPDGLESPIDGQVKYWGPNGLTVDNFVGGEDFSFTTPAGVIQTIQVRFQSYLVPIGVQGKLCP